MAFKWLEIALGAGLLGLCLLELRDPEFRRDLYRDPRRIRRNLGFGVASVAAMVLLKRLNVMVEGMQTATLLDWHSFGPLQVIPCFLVAELLGWLLHYVKHRNAFLWTFHFQHHRETQYNIWLTAHTHALEVVVSGCILALVLSLAGFAVVTIEIYLVYYGFMKAFQHSAHDYSLGRLDRVLVTPRYHRLHHEVNSACNYAITVTLFDVLFRTATWPVATSPALIARYGVGAADDVPFGFWKEMTFFLRWRRVRREETLPRVPFPRLLEDVAKVVRGHRREPD
jgi:sterol desaturase/sphingolipid hydroxylase (fatty acid hydroxylase superfamily)